MNRLKILARWGLRTTKNTAFIKQSWNNRLLEFIRIVVLTLLLICVSIVVYEFGFKPFKSNSNSINFWLQHLFYLVSFLIFLRLLLDIFNKRKFWVRLFSIAVWCFILLLTFYFIPQKANIQNTDTNRFLFYKFFIYTGIILGFISEISHFLHFIYSRAASPGVIFIGSFTFFIVLGAFLLKLPNASYTPTSNIDAFFTSASAVCVTGLTVVNTSTHFTPFGQVILLVLIQTGGLGFMTFAGLLSYAMAGNTSFKAQLAFTDYMSRKKAGNIMRFVYQVVLITFLSEMIGAISIYFSLEEGLFVRKMDKVFFSVFHSVSAFCNAGFSTYADGLNQPEIKFNYPFQLFIALLIILGGMGFPILFNLYRLAKIKLSNLINYVSGNAKRNYFPNVIIINSRLALVVSGFLIVTGFVAYLVFEQAGTLMQHPTLGGKLATSFFGSVTARTAGFNTVDLTAMTLPMVMIYLLLMWIGASPGSTGGGIKTTTAGVAIINMISILRGKDRTEFFRSEISFQSTRTAFAIIVLSLLIIGITVFAISINDSDQGLIKIAFESFSAFSTVGLSLGITASLSSFSKLVLIFTMFIGRVGAITLLVILVRQSKPLRYRYPTEDIAF